MLKTFYTFIYKIMNYKYFILTTFDSPSFLLKLVSLTYTKLIRSASDRKIAWPNSHNV